MAMRFPPHNLGKQKAQPPCLVMFRFALARRAQKHHKAGAGWSVIQPPPPSASCDARQLARPVREASTDPHSIQRASSLYRKATMSELTMPSLAGEAAAGPLGHLQAGHPLYAVCRQYLQMVPLRFFRWRPSAPGVAGVKEGGRLTSWESQQAIVRCILQHEQSRTYPVAAAYAAAWLKEYLRRCDAAGEEDIHDALYEAASSLCQGHGAARGDECFKVYVLPATGAPEATGAPAANNGRSAVQVVLQETRQYISSGTTGLVAWPAAMYLAGWGVARAGELFNGRRVLELGAGTGLVSLALAKGTAAASVTASDCHGKVLETLARNAELNGFGTIPVVDASAATDDGERSGASGFSLADLDWRCLGKSSVRRFRGHIIVGADVVYDKDIIPSLVDVLSRLLAAGASPGAQASAAYISSTLRNPATLDLFVESLRAAGLCVEVEATLPEGSAVGVGDATLVYDTTCPIVLHRITGGHA